MKLRMAYATFGFSVFLILALILAGCTSWGQSDPSGPDVSISGNTAPVTVNITDGSSSPIGTAPCGATSSQKAGTNQPTGPDCSTVTPAPVVVPPVVTP